MRATSVARRYAKATFEVAREKGDAQEWLRHIEELAAALSDQELLVILRSPNISTDQKMEAVEAVFPELPAEIKNLVRLLVERHRIDILPGVATAFGQYVDEMLGRTEADVISARGLSLEELSAIQGHLSKRTGRTVRLRTSVDPHIIGGVVMRVGDELIDASVATRLERLRQRLA